MSANAMRAPFALAAKAVCPIASRAPGSVLNRNPFAAPADGSSVRSVTGSTKFGKPLPLLSPAPSTESTTPLPLVSAVVESVGADVLTCRSSACVVEAPAPSVTRTESL